MYSSTVPIDSARIVAPGAAWAAGVLELGSLPNVSNDGRVAEEARREANDLSEDRGYGFSVLSRLEGDAVLQLPPSYFSIEAFGEDIWSFVFEGWEFADIRGVGGFYPYLFYRELTESADDWAEQDVRKWKADGERTSAARALKTMATRDPLDQRIFRFFHGLMQEGHLVRDEGLSEIWGLG